MEKRDIVCIACPVGCRMQAWKDEDGSVHVTGNTCTRGEKYGAQELTDPRRTVTSSVAVKGGERALVSVKTENPVPKDAIADVLKAIHARTLTAPVTIGQVVLENAAGTGIRIVATASMPCA